MRFFKAVAFLSIKMRYNPNPKRMILNTIITTNNFRGGKITALFGGSKIDLTKAQLAPGKNILDVFCMFGGSTLIVPENWNMKIEVTSVLGGFSDKRHIRQDTVKDVGKELIIRGFVMFGGGELKS